MARRPRFEPDFKTVERWAWKVSLGNRWRVSRTYEPDDLMQDARLIFHKLSVRYKPKNNAHASALFRTAFVRHMHSLARNYWAERHLVVTGGLRPYDYDGMLERGEPPDAELFVLAREVGGDLCAVVEALGVPLGARWRGVVRSAVRRMS